MTRISADVRFDPFRALSAGIRVIRGTVSKLPCRKTASSLAKFSR
jgi:hypothetical protein